MKEVTAPMPSTDASSLPSTTSTLTTHDDREWTASAPGDHGRIELVFPTGPAFVLDGTDELFVLPSDPGGRALAGFGTCWVLPESPTSTRAGWLIRADGAIDIRFEATGCHVTIQSTTATLTRHRARPHADVNGAVFAIDLPGAEHLADALAGFYWGTMLPCVVERTTARDCPDANGYVVSALAEKYLGTYPDVDHEFQIKGRLAWGSRADLHIVRRMIELQLRLMREDPQQLWRDPCAVQPDGTREYHVRRNSVDGSANAAMFLVTGNIEVLESVWLYIARTKDLAWLRDNIADIEGAASCVEDCIDSLGRLWSDVYYEDQVIKDGRETTAAALAVRSFELLAQLEDLLDRADHAAGYREVARKLSAAIQAPLPVGHWDSDNERFVDWVDRSGVSHDHVHLLANILPAMLAAADTYQVDQVVALVDSELDEFQRFPTFLAAHIEDYTNSEMGSAGPYDLCAAGRYWCWDAAFWSWRGNGGMLRQQLDRVARQGATEDFVMGERYDMDHVYYVDGSPWHGAAHYYEYPCVYAWVMIYEFLGVRASLTADLLIAPRIADSGSVTLSQDAYQLAYRFDGQSFSLENLATTPRTFDLELSALFPAASCLTARQDGDENGLVLTGTTVEVAPGATIHVTPAAATTAGAVTSGASR
jgi:hypothetical protein